MLPQFAFVQATGEPSSESISRSLPVTPMLPPFASMSIVWPMTSAALSLFASRIEPAWLRSEMLPVERSSSPAVWIRPTCMSPMTSSR